MLAARRLLHPDGLRHEWDGCDYASAAAPLPPDLPLRKPQRSFCAVEFDYAVGDTLAITEEDTCIVDVYSVEVTTVVPEPVLDFDWT